MTEKPEGRTLGYLEIDIPERPEILVDASTALEESALEGLIPVLVDPEPLGDVRNGYRGCRHGDQSSSTIRAECRWKKIMPTANMLNPHSAQADMTGREGKAKS